MIILDSITELSVSGVSDRGIPNKERILVRVHELTELRYYGIALAKLLPEGGVIPYDNFFYFFEQCEAEKDSWLVLYTGVGERRDTQLPTTLEKAYSMHWGFDGVVLTNPTVVPVLFRFSGIDFEGSQARLPRPALNPAARLLK